MNLRLPIIAILSFFFIVNINSLNAQNESRNNNNDSLCYKLQFYQYDTLYYKVISYDSIIIDFGDPLYKERTEYLEVVCDSVSEYGSFFLTLTMKNFKAKEYITRQQDSSIRTTSKWVGRKVQIEIDSVGKRLSFSNCGNLNAELAPGGSFQPHLFFEFDKGCVPPEKNWILESTDVLPENGFPLAVLRHTTLFRSKINLDTLGFDVNRFEYVRTGQGSVDLSTTTDSFRITNVINSYGIYDISTELWIPVHFRGAVEQVLTIHTEDFEPKKGNHYIFTEYTLDRLIPSPKRKKYYIMKP